MTRPSPYLVSGTLDEAIEAMAQRSMALAQGAPRMEKEAFEKTAVLQQLGNWWGGLDDISKKTIMGAGVGAGLGGLSSMFRDEKDRNAPGSMFTGALAGGALGLGLGAAQKFKPQPGPSTDAQGRPALPEGQFYHPVTGKPMQWDGKPSTDVLEQVGKAQGTLDSDSVLDTGLERGGRAVWNTVSNHPVTTAAGIGVAAKNLTPKPKGGGWLSEMGRKLGMGGWLVNKTMSQNPEHLQAGVEAMLKNKDAAKLIGKRQLDALKKLQQEAATDPNLWREVAAAPGGWSRILTRTGTPVLDRGTLNTVIGQGVDATTPELVKKLGVQPRLRTSLLHRLTRGRLGSPHVNMAGRGGMARTAAKYGLLLGGTLLSERAVQHMMDQRGARQDLDSIMEQYAKPVE